MGPWLVRRSGLLRQRLDRFAGVGSIRRDVRQAPNLGIVPSFGDDHSTVGMANEDHRMLRLDDRKVGRGNVAFQARRRILNDQHLIAVPRQDVVDGLPAGTIDESAMHEDYRHRLFGRHRGDLEALAITATANVTTVAIMYRPSSRRRVRCRNPTTRSRRSPVKTGKTSHQPSSKAPLPDRVVATPRAGDARKHCWMVFLR